MAHEATVDDSYVSPQNQDSEMHQENVKKKNAIYGSDNFEEYEVYYEYNGNTYKGSVTLVQYVRKEEL